MSKCSDENQTFPRTKFLEKVRFLDEDEASDSIEKKRSEFEIVTRHLRIIEYLRISGGDAFRGHTRSHPEHDG